MPKHELVLSPDGRWIAHSVDVSGRSEVYVRPFPAGGETWQVSRAGGTNVRWSPRGDELWYSRETSGVTEVFSVRIAATASQISASAPERLFVFPQGVTDFGDFHPDGQHVMALRAVGPQLKGDQVVEVLDWFAQVQARTAARWGRA